MRNTREIARLCHRRLGIGADGMIFLEESAAADFRMRIFNADGSEAEMCGNGIRCLARFIQEAGFAADRFLIETMHHKIPVACLGQAVKVQMPDAVEMNCFIPLSVDGVDLTVHYLDTGVPHAVLFVDNLEDEGLMPLAAKIRFHPCFSPKGVNVDFATIAPSGEINIRTYERGVEAETLSCGTGAAAVGVLGAIVGGYGSPVAICPRSGERLLLAFTKQGRQVTHLEMTGPAAKIYEGSFSLCGNL